MSVSDRTVNVFIVDDDHYAREALSALVARDTRTRVWGQSDSIPGALQELAEPGDRPACPDVVLLDVRMAESERAGIEGIPALRDAAPDARILVTSVASDDETVLAAVRAGADGYVWKNETSEHIALGITRVSEGRFVLSHSIADRLIGRITELGEYATEVLPDRPGHREMTENVRKTLYLFCVMGLSAREISYELQISVNTVNSRIKAAYAALGATSRSEAFRALVDGAADAFGERA